MTAPVGAGAVVHKQEHQPRQPNIRRSGKCPTPVGPETYVPSDAASKLNSIARLVASPLARVRAAKSTSKEAHMADRRAGKGPYVPSPGGGKEPRARNQDGRWREKRSDAGKPKPPKK